MIIPYELSLWIDYPGEQGIEEEKKSIIAASDQNLAGRAQNIKLKLSYTGQHTLTFEIPVKYFDIYKGEDVLNPLIEQVHVKSKIKLWRDEKWWNAFGGTQTEGDNGETIFSGAWEQGRWYEFIIKNRSEKRAKKQLIYTYEATEAFVNELSRTGYNLEFTKEDIMSINGMGTVHTLTERVLEGTDWKYIKTESFPDYKEEFSVETGEVIKTPIKTDEIELLNTEKRYGYLYDVSYNENDLVMKAFEQGDVLDYYKDWDPASGKISWYKNAQDKAAGKYTTDVYGYDKTEIITSYADRLLVEDSGVMYDSEKGSYVRTVNANLMNTTNAWEIDDKKNILGLASTIEELENKASILKYNITLKNNVNPKEYAYIKNRSFERTPLNQGDIILVKFSVVGASSDKLAFMIQDSSNNNLVIGHEIKFSNTDYLEDQFKHTYAITVPSYIKNPVVFIGVKGESVAFQQVYIYRLKGYDEFLNKTLQSAIFLNNINGLIAMADLEMTEVLQEGYKNINLNQNTIEAPDGTTQNIWLPFGKIVQNDYQDTKVVYCIEVFDKGEYKIAYLPTPTSSVKRSSYKNDKRRAIEISKSNRFSIIQEISKTFYAFSRFMVEHDKNGYIKKDVAGRPKKYITMVSQLGRTNANGFNYGVNIDTIERKLNGEQLVTKMYVEDKDNEYDKNGLMTIVDSKYNLLGERYIYNFNYYLNKLN